MTRLWAMTNAIKAQIIVVVNSIFGLLEAFDVDLSDAKQGSIIVLVNAVLALWVLLTYKNSKTRIPENSN